MNIDGARTRVQAAVCAKGGRDHVAWQGTPRGQREPAALFVGALRKKANVPPTPKRHVCVCVRARVYVVTGPARPTR